MALQDRENIAFRIHELGEILTWSFSFDHLKCLFSCDELCVVQEKKLNSLDLEFKIAK